MATTAEPPRPAVEEGGQPERAASPRGGGIVQRLKDTLGLGAGKEGAAEREAEVGGAEGGRAVSPTAAAAEPGPEGPAVGRPAELHAPAEPGAAEAGVGAPPPVPVQEGGTGTTAGVESPRVETTKLLKPQEVEVGMERPEGVTEAGAVGGEQTAPLTAAGGGGGTAVFGAPAGAAAGEQAAAPAAAAGRAAMAALPLKTSGMTSSAAVIAPGVAPGGAVPVSPKSPPPPGAGSKPAETVLADLDLASQVAQHAQQRLAAAQQQPAAAALPDVPVAPAAALPTSPPTAAPAAGEAPRAAATTATAPEAEGGPGVAAAEAAGETGAPEPPLPPHPAVAAAAATGVGVAREEGGMAARLAQKQKEAILKGETAGPSITGGTTPAGPATPAATAKLPPSPPAPSIAAPATPTITTQAGAVRHGQQRWQQQQEAAEARLPVLEAAALLQAPQWLIPTGPATATATAALQLQPLGARHAAQPSLTESEQAASVAVSEAFPWESAHGPEPSRPALLLSPLVLPVEPAAPNPPTESFVPGSAPMPLAEGAPAATAALRTAADAAAGPAAAPAAVPAVVTALPAGVHPAAAAAARLEQEGARRGRIGEGAAVVGAGAAVGAAAGPEVGAPPEPRQGDRVKVQRMPGARPGGIGPGGVTQLEARPEHEVTTMSAAEVAGMKSREHAIQAEEQQRVSLVKGQAAHQLRGQAELLEVQSQGLIAEASRQKMTRDQTLELKQRFEHMEWHGYAEAERAEAERRKVVLAARPVAVQAEEDEMEALRVRQLAADTQYHAEVLERKAQALVHESADMVQLAQEREAEAMELAAALLVKQQEQQEWQQKVDMVTAGDLPAYIEECQAEIGRLTRRITELREEVEWARLEMDKLVTEGRTWERVLAAKRSEAALLRLRMEQAREEAEEARLRSKQAAEEALEPTRLAEAKYEEAYRLQQQAEEFEERARRAQAEVLQIVQQAVPPEQTRQERLREAAEAERRAKELELQARRVEGMMERRLVDAETRAETASVLARRAAQAEEEQRAAQLTAEAQREMAGIYAESEERHAALPAHMARVGAPPVTPEAREMVRQQRERFGAGTVTVLPTVPVEAPAVPIAPPTTTQVAEMLAQMPPAPTHPVHAGPAAAAAGAAEPAGPVEAPQRVPVAA